MVYLTVHQFVNVLQTQIFTLINQNFHPKKQTEISIGKKLQIFEVLQLQQTYLFIPQAYRHGVYSFCHVYIVHSFLDPTVLQLCMQPLLSLDGGTGWGYT